MAVPFADHHIYRLSSRVVKSTLRGIKIWEEPHIVRMIYDRQEIKRTA